MARVVVAGATGYLGRFVVRALVARGHHVVALCRPGKTVAEASVVAHVDVLQPSTLRGVCEGATAVFSGLGITRQNDGVTYEDVEFLANGHVLDEAIRAGASRFGLIAAVRPDLFGDLAIAASKERFISRLRAEGPPANVRPVVVRATGFFSDLSDVFDMARSGRVWMIGDGRARVNPVHGEDLAEVCADALLGEGAYTNGVPEDVEVGGPEVFSWNEIVDLAEQSLGQPVARTHLPPALVGAALSVVGLVRPRAAAVGRFIARGAVNDVVAPCHGRHRLGELYQELAHAS